MRPAHLPFPAFLLFQSSGDGATAHLETGGFIRSQPGVPHPDIQFHFLPSQVIDHGRVPTQQEAYQVHRSSHLPHCGSALPAAAQSTRARTGSLRAAWEGEATPSSVDTLGTEHWQGTPHTNSAQGVPAPESFGQSGAEARVIHQGGF